MLRRIKLLLLIMIVSFFNNASNAKYEKLAYDFLFNDLSGNEIKLSDFKNKVIVVINVASQCGFTNQYKNMQELWDKYQKRNFVVIGVPSNDFGNQEPGSSAEIKKFCESKFSISFPMTEKVTVKGKNAHPFYLWAKKNHGSGAVPKWNFHKIIINKSGKIEKTFTSITNPSSSKFTKTIEDLL